MVYEKSSDNKRAIVNLVNVCKSLGNNLIINNISLTIPENSIFAVIGPNGAGKTTLLRLILELIKNDSGVMEYNINKEKISTLLENDYLFENKTGNENIDCFSRYFGINIMQNDLVEKYSTLLKLNNQLDKKVHKYSKGMKRKLSILITLLRDSEFIIFDEPTSGVDPESRIAIRKLLKILKDEKKTILITSHDLAEVEKTCDFIAVIKNGRIMDVIKNSESINLENRFFEILKEGNCNG